VLSEDTAFYDSNLELVLFSDSKSWFFWNYKV
jgi:hypothetical protein